MYSRQTTPPTSSFSYMPGSVGSDATYYSQGSSPDVHNVPTPPRSPIRQHGPLLLPKVRTQDQVAEPTQGPIRHRRTTSTSSASYGYSPYSRPASMVRRGSSPLNHNMHSAHSTLASPVSTSSYDFSLSTLNSLHKRVAEPRPTWARTRALPQRTGRVMHDLAQLGQVSMRTLSAGMASLPTATFPTT
jgi:hypothetical protein